MIIIVGAGISGSVLAHEYATKLDKRVLIVEKRFHVGGNCYDFYDDAGVLVPLYGPHFFHTKNKGVWDYVSQFTEWHEYQHRVKSRVDGKLVPVPVNIETVNILLNQSISSEAEMVAWLEANTEDIAEPANGEEAALARVGQYMYEKLFKGYTKKQWDLDPSELAAAVLNRIPVRTNFDDRYFTDPYQAMPKHGYHKLFENMLNHPNIEVRLNTDFFNVRAHLPEAEKVFFTGRIDSFFEKSVDSPLQYRSLNFEFESLEQEWFQEGAQINYPNDFDFTRITEPKHATGQQHVKTTIIREYPTWDGEPYYPVHNPKNERVFQEYQYLAEREAKNHIHFVGRLANYKYFNMDQAFENALSYFQSLEANRVK